MPTLCLFPLCKSYAQDNGLCTAHGRIYKPEDLKGVAKRDTPASGPKTLPKKKKAIKKRSKKMTTVMAEVKKLYPIFLKANSECAIKAPGCIGQSTVVHHVKGRGKKIGDQNTWVPCCPPCNSYVEQNHQWAADRGFKQSRHKIEQ